MSIWFFLKYAQIGLRIIEIIIQNNNYQKKIKEKRLYSWENNAIIILQKFLKVNKCKIKGGKTQQ